MPALRSAAVTCREHSTAPHSAGHAKTAPRRGRSQCIIPRKSYHDSPVTSSPNKLSKVTLDKRDVHAREVQGQCGAQDHQV